MYCVDLKKNHKPRILHPVKLSFRIEDKIKTFLVKKTLRKLLAVDLPDKRCFKKFSRENRYDIGQKLGST